MATSRRVANRNAPIARFHGEVPPDATRNPAINRRVGTSSGDLGFVRIAQTLNGRWSSGTCWSVDAWNVNHIKKPRSLELRGFGTKTLAMTYSRMLNAHYHRRVRVSLPSSGWDRVVPRSYYHQGEGGGSRVTTDHNHAHTLSFCCLRTSLESGSPLANKLGRSKDESNIESSQRLKAT